MRRGYRLGLVGVVLSLAAGCATQRPAIAPAAATAMLQSGQPVLGCRQACLAAWQSAEPQAQQLAAAARWQDLAVLIVQVGYQDDLTLYYLGLAAEGLGYSGGAASFYRQSMQLSGTSIACQNLSHRCGGVALPREASVRLAAIDRELSRRQSHRRRALPRRPEASPSETPALPAAAPGPAETLPPPPPLPSPPAAPLPVPQAPPPHGSEYIEPPPLVR